MKIESGGIFLFVLYCVVIDFLNIACKLFFPPKIGGNRWKHLCTLGKQRWRPRVISMRTWLQSYRWHAQHLLHGYSRDSTSHVLLLRVLSSVVIITLFGLPPRWSAKDG